MAINILVVDDSAVMRSMIIRTIRNCGVEVGEVLQAGNGKEGLEALEDSWLDLLFIDVNMPVMDGMEMLEELKQRPDTRDLPVLIVSTESNQERINRIEELGAGFVHKPFTPEKLRERILDSLGVLN
jgi:two-component system chemotaxis response regulator CheY